MSLSELTLLAPAKLNLFLHIVGRRIDGYHELQTLFQLLDYGDTVFLKKNTNGGLQFTCSNPELETTDNLIVKAVRALEFTTNRRLNVTIHLDKLLPMGGGIGGGSSDCATTLLGLNKLFELDLPSQTLLDLGKSLGADVPVFINGKSAWAEGIGEHLTKLLLPENWFLVVKPNVHVATPALFAHPELTRNTPTSTIHTALAQTGHNDFEPLVRKLYPTIESAFQQCAPFGKAKLTGTGACLFLTLPTKAMAEELLAKLQRSNPDFSAFIAQGTNTSKTIMQLNEQSLS